MYANNKNKKNKKLKEPEAVDLATSDINTSNDSNTRMDSEDIEPQQGKDELTLLKEQNKHLLDEIRQLKENLARTSQIPTNVSENIFSALPGVSNTSGNLPMPEDKSEKQGLSPRTRMPNEEWKTVIKSRNQRQITPRQNRGSMNGRQNTIDNTQQRSELYGKTPTKKKEKVPPINIHRQDVKDTIEILSKVLNNKEFKIKRKSDNQHKLILNSYEEHAKARNILKEVDAQFYTYTPKVEKIQTFMLKGIDSSFDPTDVLMYLKEKENELLKFTNVTRHSTAKSTQDKRVLPLYRVQISADSIAGKLHEIKHLAHQVIWWEKIKKTDTVQCKNCQRLGHTASNCNMKYRCVKCNIPHGPKECQLDTNRNDCNKEVVFCALCQSFGHPASYRGCPKQAEFKAKQIQINNLRGNSKENRYIKQIQERQAASIVNRLTTPRKSFADQLKNPTKRHTNLQENVNNNTQTNVNRGPKDFASVLEAMQQQFSWVIQAVQSNTEKIDKLFALIQPNQITSYNG